MKYPVIVSTNCSGANFYHNYLNLQFYSPFIWSVISYSDIIKLIEQWNNINFLSYKIVKNKTRELTYTLIIDDLIRVNYVHYFYSDTYEEPFYKGASVFSKNIIKFIEKKYVERTNRMINYGDISNPYFIIHEEEYTNENDPTGFQKICELKSDFKRALITHKNYKAANDKNSLLIKSDNKLLPQNMIEKYGNNIKDWFKINDEIFKTNKVSLNMTTNHQ